MSSISKFLTVSLLKIFAISCLLTMLAYQILNSKYNKTLEQKQGNFIESMTGVFWTLALTICSLTVYFNNIEVVRNKPILCILSFFLLPVTISFVFWYLGNQNGQWLSFYVSTIIFLLTLSFFYYKFTVLYSNKNIGMH